MKMLLSDGLPISDQAGRAANGLIEVSCIGCITPAKANLRRRRGLRDLIFYQRSLKPPLESTRNSADARESHQVIENTATYILKAMRLLKGKPLRSILRAKTAASCERKRALRAFRGRKTRREEAKAAAIGCNERSTVPRARTRAPAALASVLRCSFENLSDAYQAPLFERVVARLQSEPSSPDYRAR